MHVKRGDIDEWIRKLEERGIEEFQFKDLPDDLKYRKALQKAKELGLLKSVNITNFRHTWKIVSSNKSKKIQGEKKRTENGVGNTKMIGEYKEKNKENDKKEGIKNEFGACLYVESRVEKEGNNDI